MNMRVSDYIFEFLSARGVDTLFMVSGGQAMFLVDSVYQNKKINAICTHHEQSAGMAAEAYARISWKTWSRSCDCGTGEHKCY